MIYDNIRTICEKKNISIKQVERELGFSNSSICKWNECEPSVWRVQKVADYLGVSMEYLLSDQKEASWGDRQNKILSWRCHNPHHRWHHRKFYRDGDSSTVRDIVIRVVMIAMTIGRTICNKTNCKLNHCLLSTSAMPSSSSLKRVSSRNGTGSPYWLVLPPICIT